MRWLHLAVGIVGVAGFLGTGQYMDLVHDHLRGMDDTHRLLFRSTHIYLLFASLVNLALGLHLKPVRGWRWWLRSLGSLLVLGTSSTHTPPVRVWPTRRCVPQSPVT